MSVPAAERSAWRGEAVGVSAVLRELARLAAEHFAHPHGHATAHTLNLVVGPAAAGAGAAVAELLGSLTARLPSRTILLREHAADRLDAEVAIDCELSGPGAGLCHDRVILSADRARLERAASLVRPLLVRGLPTVAWLPGPEPHALEESLALLGDAAVVDSGAAAAGDARAGLRRAGALAARTRVCDLAWGRIDRWRARVAAAFDEPARLDVLGRVASLDVVHSGCAADALLLCGWIAARAGWRIDALEEGPAAGAFAGRAARAGGGGAPVELTVVPGAGDRPAGVERVSFAGALELERGPLVQRPADELADALAAGDAYTRGYPEALAALGATDSGPEARP